MILLIDNYDSFVHNLARYFQRLGQETSVVRNDRVNIRQIADHKYEAIVISPGPKTPTTSGQSLAVIEQFHLQIPILGICLGHQCVATVLGSRIVRAREPVHGRCSEIFHDGQRELAKLSNPFMAGRYHSLVVDSEDLPGCLEVSATSTEGTVMGVRHRDMPVFGWQFHPESIMTTEGFRLLAGFLREAKLSCAESLPTNELVLPIEHATSLDSSARPVTF